MENNEATTETTTTIQTEEVHNHFASTDIDPRCDLCALAITFRPIEEAGR